jgi:hypothetical protein
MRHVSGLPTLQASSARAGTEAHLVELPAHCVKDCRALITADTCCNNSQQANCMPTCLTRVKIQLQWPAANFAPYAGSLLLMQLSVALAQHEESDQPTACVHTNYSPARSTPSVHILWHAFFRKPQDSGCYSTVQ